jgi:uncharacterized protein (TIGR02594 family)
MLVYVTPYTLALRFEGLAELPGAVHNPQVLSMLQLVDKSVHDDETPWCSAFVNYCTFLLDTPRSKSLAARSWLRVGTPVPLTDARPGYDVVVLSRGKYAPGPMVLDAPGHVGFYVRTLHTPERVVLFGGNQGDKVCFEEFPAERVLGVRRLG